MCLQRKNVSRKKKTDLAKTNGFQVKNFELKSRKVNFILIHSITFGLVANSKHCLTKLKLDLLNQNNLNFNYK